MDLVVLLEYRIQPGRVLHSRARILYRSLESEKDSKQDPWTQRDATILRRRLADVYCSRAIDASKEVECDQGSVVA